MARENINKSVIEKIEMLQSALFFSESSDRVITSAVLQQVYTDDQAQVWFAVPKPAYEIDPNYVSFPCRMDFFKKGAAFHIKISGLATITGEETITGCPTALADIITSSGKQQQMIVKVKLEQTELFEIAPLPVAKNTNNKLDFISHTFNKIVGQFLGNTWKNGVTA